MDPVTYASALFLIPSSYRTNLFPLLLFRDFSFLLLHSLDQASRVLRHHLRNSYQSAGVLHHLAPVSPAFLSLLPTLRHIIRVAGFTAT